VSALEERGTAAAVNYFEVLIDLILSFNRNFRMSVESAKTLQGWTDERSNDEDLDRSKDWLDSDFRNVAMPFVYPVYEKMLSIAELTAEKN
jgi:hypothetical protein